MSGNLFAALPVVLPDEAVTTLLHTPTLRLERIVSTGHASPPGFWYDQDEHEWVVVLQGQGEVEFQDGRNQTLHPGDWLNIPARCRHRVAATSATEPTIWLAIFYRNQ